jgi:thiamine-monophosphate kinase
MARTRLKPRAFREDRFVRGLVSGMPSGGRVVLGPGDDCAAVRIAGVRRLLLLKTDCIVEGIHFEASLAPRRVGRKALCRVLSDFAAMGGEPGEALVTVLTPTGIPASYWRGVYEGLRGVAVRFGVVVVGGETSAAPFRAVSVAATGWVAQRTMVRRSGGRSGDVLFTTGRLGGSLRRRHWAFEPRLAAGAWLARNGFARAMIDLSDGLASDLPRLAEASGCGFRLDESAIPRAPGCPVAEALSDGEDYELLFACPAAKTPVLEARWKTAFPRILLTPIGFLAPAGVRAGLRACPPGSGFDHLARPNP